MSIALVLVLSTINYLGITESVLTNVVMTVIEVGGLVIVVVIAAIHVSRGDADASVLTEFNTQDGVFLAIISGVAFSFFAMTGFENAANVAEEVIEPEKAFPRALIGGMLTAGVIYVVVSVSAALVVDVGHPGRLGRRAPRGRPGGRAAHLGRGCWARSSRSSPWSRSPTPRWSRWSPRRGSSTGWPRRTSCRGSFSRVHPTRRTPAVAIAFSAAVVCALLLAGWALNQAGVGVDVVARLATVTVVFLLFIYALVIVSALVLRGDDETEHTYRAPTVLLLLGVVGNVVLLGYVVYDDPFSLVWCGALLAIGGLLFAVQYANAKRKGVEIGGGTRSRTARP